MLNTTYSQGVAVPLPPATTLVSISGQISLDKDGEFIGHEDALVQAEVCFAQIRQLVEAAGGTLRDVIHLRYYLTDFADLDQVLAARDQCDWGSPPPASTAVQVAALAQPPLKVEIEAMAVLRHRGALEGGMPNFSSVRHALRSKILMRRR